MRHLVLIAAFSALAAPASASSIEAIVSGKAVNQSIRTIDCSSCPPLVEKKEKSTYTVADIEPGTQKIELKTINGEMKTVRTEAWMGGSPVVFVSKATEDVIKAHMETQQPTPGISLETVASTTKTLPVVGSDAAVKAASLGGQKAASREFDPALFEMRLD